MRFIDLFAGLGGFHYAMRSYGHECVFASELDPELRRLYALNFPEAKGRVWGDIRESKHAIPSHDILCAGFPCQPFSKSGSQAGTQDVTRGTLFHEILEILAKHRPEFVILENVGNFERHDAGRTWSVVRQGLMELGYDVRGTEHRAGGGHGLISPHHFGFPHHRERFFVVARRSLLPLDPFPRDAPAQAFTLDDLVQSDDELSDQDRRETALTVQQIACVDHWNRFLQSLPEAAELPSFPIWGDEFEARYPFEGPAPATLAAGMLQPHVPGAEIGATLEEILSLLPSYARRPGSEFPVWKKTFIRQNRAWYSRIQDGLPPGWLEELKQFPPSLRKLEWNCQGEERNLWSHVLQFRPSGLRVKRYKSIPALVAMTTTQIPILGPKRRFLTKVDGLRLQGFPDSHALPASRARAFRALGNAVHVKVVSQIGDALLEARRSNGEMVPTRASNRASPI